MDSVTRPGPSRQVLNAAGEAPPPLRSSAGSEARTRLGIAWLFAAALIPGMLSACALFYFVYVDQVEQLQMTALQTARTLNAVVDQDLASIKGRLETLATSRSLANGDLAPFYLRAQQVLGSEKLAQAVVVIDPSGQMILNTLRPLGEPLPLTGHPGLLRETLAKKRLVISDLYIENATKRPFVTVEVPVLRDGEVAYVIDMAIPTARLSQLLSAQGLPPGWVAAIVDSHGTVVGRSLNPERTVGKPATPDLQAALSKAREGHFASHTLEGTASFVAFSSSPLSDWTVAVAMTRSVLYANLYRPLGLVALTMAAFLLGGALLARVFSRRVGRALRSLEVVVSAATGGDLQAAAPVSGTREIAKVSEQFNRMQDARRKTEAQLRLSASVFSVALEGIIIADREGNIIDVNDAFTDLTGHARADVIGQNPRFLKSAKHGAEFYQSLWQTLGREGVWRGKLWNVRKDGVPFAAHMTISAVTDPDGAVAHYVGVFSDVTDAQRQQEEIERMAYFDPLTQLPNRRLLSDRIKQALSNADRQRTLVGIAYLDLDGFKLVNDSFGHKAGDQILVEVAHRLTGTLRAHDTVARVGGDEFVLLLPGIAHETETDLILLRVVAAFNQRFSLSPTGSASIFASIGVACYPSDAATAETLLRCADLAMYEAKRTGRNQVRHFRELDSAQAGA